MARYVGVDMSTGLLIPGELYEWDGESEWTSPGEGTLMLESDALNRGYDWPNREPQREEGDPL